MLIRKQSWEQIKNTHSVNMKAEMLHQTVMNKVSLCFPEKNIKVTSDDSPWCNEKVKKLKRLKAREYRKHRSSTKWKSLNEVYKTSLGEAKTKYYKNIVKDLKLSNPSQWYSKLKRICSYDQQKFEPLVCSEIEHLSDQEQADEIAKHFCAVREKFEEVKPYEIKIPKFTNEEIPKFTEMEVASKLKSINPRKAVPRGDIPPKVLKEFSHQLTVPITDIINSSIRNGVWPDMWEIENVTPVAKIYPPKKP